MSWRLSVSIPWIDGAVAYRVFADGQPTDPPEVAAVLNQPTPFSFLVPDQPDAEAVIRTQTVYADGHVGPLSDPLTVTGLATPATPPPPEPPPPDPTPVSGEKWQGCLADVAGFSKGWFCIFWDAKRERVINLFGQSGHPEGDNSVRAYYPATNTWKVLLPSNGGTAGMQNRDNYVGWIVGDELIIIGGTYQDVGTNYQNFGRFDLVNNAWIEVGKGDTYMENFSTWGRSLGGHGYCPELDTFVTYYPVENQPTVGWLHVLQPGTTKRYKHSALAMPTGIGSRKETHNAGAVAGTDFYLYGGRPTGTTTDKKDFWTCDLKTFTWKRLPDAPWALYQPVLTFDSVNNCLVLHGGAVAGIGTRNTALFDRATETWTDVTATMEIFADANGNRPHKNRLRAGCYGPSVNRHWYTGGNNRTDFGTAEDWTLSRKVDSLTVSRGVIEMPKTIDVDALEITNVPEGNYTVKVQLVAADGSVAGEGVSNTVSVAADPPAVPVVGVPTIAVRP